MDDLPPASLPLVPLGRKDREGEHARRKQAFQQLKQQQQQVQQQQPEVHEQQQQPSPPAGGRNPMQTGAHAGSMQAQPTAVDIEALGREVQAAPRFGLNGKALILLAAAASQKAPASAAAPPGAAAGGSVRGKRGAEAQPLSCAWKPSDLAALVPAKEQPFVTYVPRSNIPRLLRQNGVQTLLGLYLSHVLDLLQVQDEGTGLKMVKGDAELRKAATAAAVAHETWVYKQVTSKQAYSQLLSSAKCDSERLPQQQLQALKERHAAAAPRSASGTAAGTSGVGGQGTGQEAGRLAGPSTGAPAAGAAAKRRKRRRKEDLFGSDSEEGEEEEEEEEEAQGGAEDKGGEDAVMEEAAEVGSSGGRGASPDVQQVDGADATEQSGGVEASGQRRDGGSADAGQTQAGTSKGQASGADEQVRASEGQTDRVTELPDKEQTGGREEPGARQACGAGQPAPGVRQAGGSEATEPQPAAEGGAPEQQQAGGAGAAAPHQAVGGDAAVRPHANGAEAQAVRSACVGGAEASGHQPPPQGSAEVSGTQGPAAAEPSWHERQDGSNESPDGAPAEVDDDAMPQQQRHSSGSRLRFQVTEFVKTVLEPMYRARLITKEVWKSVVRSAVDKILERHAPPGAAASADFLISESESIRKFVSKLVMWELKNK